MPKLVFVVTEDWYFVSHRLALATEAIRRGYEVVLVTRLSTFRSEIERHGIRVIPFDTNRRGMNPLGVLAEAFALARIYRQEQPDIVHHVALRAVMVGGLAARLCGIDRVLSAITGMGFLFTGGGRKPWVRQMVGWVLPQLVSRGLVIVQNSDDGRQIAQFGVPTSRLRHIAGVGVNTEKFHPVARDNEQVMVMLAARLLWDKGVGEFVEAARLLQHTGARFVLVGMIDVDNPAGVPREQVDAWTRQGIVEWWGHQQDMASALSRADIFCLPSYREGLPKALLEAMSCGLPCVSTDVPGCREVVRHGDTGLLVPAGDGAALAAAIASLIRNPEQRLKMGARGRQRAVDEYSEVESISATMRVYEELMN
ncbi:glycosyltransferase family 4 protein [Devosia sp. LjRoot16]|uniref:glycosyltransferase family 4 protein n=1 Tax=Devosia sp. LjRoot16 TaxID=3342271 RepID=UPI003ECD286E